jgi:GAF domain-containing protein
MSRRRIGLYGAHEESLRLARLLADAADAEVVRVFDPDPADARARALALDPAWGAAFGPLVGDDFDAFVAGPALDVIVDDGQLPPLADRLARRTDPAEARDATTSIVSPLMARLLFGYAGASDDRKSDLLQALSEVVESVELTIDSRALFTRMLEIAVGVTHADGGSLMLLDRTRRELFIQVALGVEPELWHKIRVPVGEGLAGRAAATAAPVHVTGKADGRHFHILRERADVASALCVPLVEDGTVLGVLNLHHNTRADAFDAEDVRFVEQLAHLDAQIIQRAQEHARLRDQAARYEAVREVHDVLAGPAPLVERLQAVCARVADRMGAGIANVYLHDATREPGELLLTATSLAGGGFGGEYRIVMGQGVDGGVARTRRPTFLHGENDEIAYAALPLLVGERLVGVLAAQGGDHPPRGRAAEEALLEIASAVAEGVHHARREADMRTRATRMGAINETGIRMLSATDVDEVARLATSSLAMILDADHAVLRLQDPRSRRYRVASYLGSADDALQPRLFELDKQVAIEAIKRRTSFAVRELARDSKWAAFGEDFTSLISAPLKSAGDVVGTVSVYDKVAIDRFFVGRFTDEDVQVFSRLVSYVERAVANAQAHEEARAHSSFDSATGLPNARYVESRLREELARCHGRERALAVAVCRIENADALEAAPRPHQLHRVRLATADALRIMLRDFDVVGCLDDTHFAVLLPEPGEEPADRVAGLARGVAEYVHHDAALNEPVPVELAFGYALHPDDGKTAEALLARAREPRIRRV